MSSLLRRLRGLVGMAVTWGAGWFGVSAVGWGIALWGQVPLGVILNLAAGVGLAGAIAGAGFAVIVGIAERRHSFEEISFLRFAAWGALGGILVGLPFIGELIYVGYLGPFFGILGGLGASSAAGTLALARMGADAESLREAGDRRTLPAHHD